MSATGLSVAPPSTTPRQTPAFFAILSDIHANIDALDTVLEDMKDYAVRGTFCLGDIVGYLDPSAELMRPQCGNRYAINIGSVGQPRDGDPRACYALYDYQNRLLLHRRVKYDLRKAQARFRSAGLPCLVKWDIPFS